MENIEREAMQVASGAGKTLWVLGDLYEFKATGEDTGGRFALWKTTTPPGNPGPPPHIHHNEDEVFYLLEGEWELMVEGRASVVGAGTFANIPKTPYTPSGTQVQRPADSWAWPYRRGSRASSRR